MQSLNPEKQAELFEFKLISMVEAFLKLWSLISLISSCMYDHSVCTTCMYVDRVIFVLFLRDLVFKLVACFKWRHHENPYKNSAWIHDCNWRIECKDDACNLCKLYNELQGWLFRIWGRISLVSHLYSVNSIFRALRGLHVLVRVFKWIDTLSFDC